MMVLILRNVRPSLRGHLSRWLIQPHSGVLVGHPSGRIRELLWKQVCQEIDTRGGSAVLIHPEANEQGYRILTRGDPPREMVDFDGLTLPKSPRKRRQPV